MGIAQNTFPRTEPRRRTVHRLLAVTRRAGIAIAAAAGLFAQPVVFDPNLTVRTVVTGLVQPTTMAFLGSNDFLVLEKASGKVQRVTNGVLQAAPALDLPVNSASERGLLGIALHPDFPRNPGVYLYWTESTATNAAGQFIDSAELADVPLLGNRVDRFVWNDSKLTFERNLIKLRAFQADAGQPLRGNHDGGIICFERSHDDNGLHNGDANHRDGRGNDDERHKAKLFIIIGDNGRRGQTQNLRNGPFGPGVPDDQFGGPQPDNAHLTGVVLRLNDDGTTPTDNPFYEAGKKMGGEVGANIQKIFAYGVRNSFGMAVDPRTGYLWNQENGDDSFDEINLITPGQNNGWVQVMGPIRRVAQFKDIETSAEFFGLQQIRWPPTNIADTPEEARSRLFMLPGAHYADPVFSWKYAIAPAAIGFLDSRALGREYEDDLFVGASRPTLDSGYIMRFKLTGNRRSLEFTDRRLNDGVADNTAKFDPAESESLRFGTNFGVGTDIRTGPNGNLYVVSLSNGAVYEITRK
jgi:aldose sugar dehydrogenase